MAFIDFFSPTAKAEKKQVENAVLKMVEIIKTQNTAYVKEIKHLKMARFHAMNTEMPRRKMLIDFYYEILENESFAFGRANTRTLRISNKDFVIANNGENDLEKTKLLQKGWFTDLIKMVHESIYFGYTLPFIDQLDEEGMVKSVDMVYRDHIIPEKCQILKRLEDANGIDFTTEQYAQWSFFVNHKHSLGLLNKIAHLYIFKKHSWQNWDEFEEKFGIPMRIAKTASTDKRVLREIDKWLSNLGSSGTARFPEGTDLEIKESRTTDSWNVFNEKRKACNEEIATVFDGHFETAKDTGSRAKAGSIIESTQNLITADDAKFVKHVINDKVIPLLINLGYPFTTEDIFDWNENTKLEPKDRLAIYQGVQKLGYTPSKETLEAEFDIVLEDEPKKTEPSNTNQPPTSNDSGSLGNFKTPHSSHSCGAHPEDYRIAVYNMTYNLSEDELKLLRAIANGTVNWSYNEFKHHHNKLLQALREGIGQVDTSFAADGHKMENMMRISVHRFGFDKTVAEVFQLNEIFNSSQDFSEFRERALKLFPNYKLHWLNTEFQQAFAASQMGTRWQEMQQNIAIAPYWRYQAVLDELVRESHKALHSKVFRKDDAESARFLPPIGYNCRCDVTEELTGYDGEISTIDDAISSDPDLWQQMQKTGHDVNWGDTGQVFSSTQSYLRKVRANNINYTDLQPSDFGLKSTVATNLKLNETTFKWRKKLDINRNLKLTDVNGQPRWITEELLDRSPEFLVNQLQELLQIPDEIYHFTEGGNMVYNYIKHYRETSVITRVEFNRQRPAFITQISQDADINSLRNGLLIYNKPDAISFERQLYEQAKKDLDLRPEKGFDEKTGGWFVTEKGHLDEELPLNISVVERMIQQGHRFVLRTPIQGKTYDALWNDIPFEIKVLTNYTNLKNRLKKEAQKGTKQGLGNVLVALNGYYNTKEVIQALLSLINQPTSGDRLKNVVLILPDNRLIRISRKEILDGTFKILL